MYLQAINIHGLCLDVAIKFANCKKKINNEFSMKAPYMLLTRAHTSGPLKELAAMFYPHTIVGQTQYCLNSPYM